MEGRKNSDVFSVWKIHVRIGQEKPERESTMKNLQEDIQNQFKIRILKKYIFSSEKRNTFCSSTEISWKRPWSQRGIP